MDFIPFDIISEKRKQEYLILQKIKPENVNVASKIILQYDLSNRLLPLLRENCNNYDKIVETIQIYFSKRKDFLEKMTMSL